jgi:hypothetical protein
VSARGKYKPKAQTLIDIERQQKLCRQCKTERSFEEFHVSRKSADGRASHCMSCKNAGTNKTKARVRADIERQRKICPLCGIEKSFEEFNVKINNADERTTLCKTCMVIIRRKAYEEPGYKNKVREASYQKKYGISILDFNKMLAAQGDGCAICGNRSSGKRKLSVDHAHDSLIIRGILCSGCNTGLGGFRDSKENLLAAIKYLEKSDISS